MKRTRNILGSKINYYSPLMHASSINPSNSFLVAGDGAAFVALTYQESRPISVVKTGQLVDRYVWGLVVTPTRPSNIM